MVILNGEILKEATRFFSDRRETVSVGGPDQGGLIKNTTVWEEILSMSILIKKQIRLFFN